MSKFRARFWGSAGLAILAGAGLAACGPGGEGGEQGASHAGAAHGEAGEAARGETGGESGGEAGGEGGGAALAALAPADQDWFRAAMMKGHLAAGLKLAEEGAAAEASPHFLHPIHEVYGAAEADYKARGKSLDVTAFNAAAEAAASGKPIADIRAAHAGLLDQIQTLTPKAAPSPAALKAIMGQLSHEYEEGVQGGAVVNAIEYQDAYGFAIVLRDLLKDRGGEAAAEAEKLVALFPSAKPPAAPPALGQVQAQLSRIELALAS